MIMQNGMDDLRNHLFAQLERLGDESIMSDPKKAEQEIRRAKEVSNAAGVIVHSAKVEVDFLKVKKSTGNEAGTTFFQKQLKVAK